MVTISCLKTWKLFKNPIVAIGEVQTSLNNTGLERDCFGFLLFSLFIVNWDVVF